MTRGTDRLRIAGGLVLTGGLVQLGGLALPTWRLPGGAVFGVETLDVTLAGWRKPEGWLVAVLALTTIAIGVRALGGRQGLGAALVLVTVSAVAAHVSLVLLEERLAAGPGFFVTVAGALLALGAIAIGGEPAEGGHAAGAHSRQR